MVILLEPCEKTEHEGFGFTNPVFNPDQKQTRYPRPENGDRVLFFGCVGCDDDQYRELMPLCPEKHRPWRYFSQNSIGCRACDHYVAINQRPVVAA